jgi:hypothetical protein
MARTPDSVTVLSQEEARKLTWKPHKHWQAEWLSSFDPDPEEGPVPKFAELKSKGEERWKKLAAAERRLDPDSQAARDWFFENYYTTTSSDGVNVASNYNALPETYTPKGKVRPQSYSTARQKGEYTAAHATGKGVMIPNQTYALGGGGETYYNPKTQKEERMPPSEILFQQWRMAAKKQGQERPKLKVKEETVAGDAWKMIKEIRRAAETGPGDVTFTQEQDAFYAMLAIPNVTACIYLIQDHGRELEIRTITKIVVRKNSHIEVHFG